MHVLFCGVRGSTPATGPDFVRYGGNTSCVAVAHDDHDPTLVLDAGTGLSRLSRRLDGRPFRGTMLLGHLHWDHTHGLPFFPAGDRDGSDVTVLIPAQGDAEQVLARAISPPHFPITPAQLRGNWRFAGLDPGHHRIEGFDVTATEIPHKGGRTYGFRVADGDRTLAYLSDHWPVSLGDGADGLGPYHPAATGLAAGVDVLVHDAQYTAAEFATPRREFGHSAVEYAVGLAATAGARRLVLFHHDPSRTDDQIDALVAACDGRGVDVTAAAEGMTLDL
ncbi:MAG TPA: MBL fold metallo-hydrolase [Acidimicrobiales bacterium]|nr:MBL fold metallo-hydrolase [Acidimicrobiales bacterium]